MIQPLAHAILISLFLCNAISAQVLSEWRGPGRTGIYNETNLLKIWPEQGPDLLWVLDSLPNGYSSVALAHQMIYLTGIVDSTDVLVAIDREGRFRWQKPTGRSWNSTYNPSRCTPTIDGDRAYVSTGMGDVACLNALTGDLVWSVKASEVYEGTYGKWGIAESLLIRDDMVFFTPGGNKTTMVAFNKMTGEEIWVSESLNDNPSYTSPLLIEWAGSHTIVNVTENFVFGVNPLDGSISWTFDFGVFAGGEWRTNNQINTPTFAEGKIFITNGYDHKSVQIALSEKGDKAYFHWVNTTLDVHHGGVVKIGDYLYGASWEGNRDGRWVCLEWETGKRMYEVEWENKGSIIAADNLLYCYEEKNGNLALVEPSPDGFNMISSFLIPHGKGPHWSHPVIHEGILYIRHGQALMAYSVREKELD